MIYKSNLIIENHSIFVDKCKTAYDKITNKFNTKNTTEIYGEYNIFL